MKKTIFLPVKRMAVVLTVILAGFASFGSLHAQTEAALTQFNFVLGTTYPSVINESAGTIVVPVYNTADITTLIATYTASAGAVVKVGAVVQTSGVGAKDYTSGVTFVVTSGNGLVTKSYLVSVTKNPILTDKQLLTFYFNGVAGSTGVINHTDYTVKVTVPYSQSLTNLTAVFTSSPVSTVYIGTALQESGSTANDFSGTVIYKVVAENTSVRNYYVTVTKAPPSTAKSITSFEFRSFDPDIVGSINETTHAIALTVPFSADVTNLIATFAASPAAVVAVGAAVQTSGETPNNFTNPVVYTVTAENSTTQTYTVTVAKAPGSSAKDITSFSFQGLLPPVAGVIDGNNISLTVPYNTPLTALVATFTNSLLSTVTVNGAPQTSGVTTNNFTIPLTYVVKAEDNSTKSYTVTVSVVPPLTGKQILTFDFPELDPDVIGVINESADPKTIALLVPYGTDVTDLVPTFTNSPESIVYVGGNPQTSGVSGHDFTNTIPYVVVAQDATQVIYYVTVSLMTPSQENSILSFSFEEGFDPDLNGVIDEGAKTITVTVPYSADVTAIKASFTSSLYSTVWIGSVQQTSGVTENNFTTPLVYKCKAQDGSFELYTVTIVRAPVSLENDILTFNFAVGFEPDIIGVVSGNTVTLTVPNSTVVTNLVATFTLSPYATLTVNDVPQVSGVTGNDFTSPVVYKCISEESSFDYYTVTVVKAPVEVGREFLTFQFAGLTPVVNGFISTQSIAVSVPWTTNVTNLVATFTVSPMAKVTIGTFPQVSGVTNNDFTSPIVYTVTSESGITRNYTVTVTRVPLSTACVLTDMRFGTINPIIGVIDQTAKTVTVTAPYNTDLTTMKAIFTVSDLATVRVAGVVQVSNSTINDFTTPKIYEVTAEDGVTKNLYTVTVTIYVMPKEFLTFKFDTYTLIEGDTVRYVANGTINNTTRIVQLNIPFSADKTSLKAIYTLTPNTTAYIGTVLQTSGVTANDFTSNRSYSLAASDGSSVGYEVRVTNNPVDTQKQITAFSFAGLSPVVNGVISEAAKTINLLVPFGTNKTALVATYSTTSNLTRVKIGAAMQKSALTPNDFTNPLVYRCFDEAGNFVEYVVTVTTQTGSPLKDITSFVFQDLTPDVVGAINEVNRTITATVPNGVNRATLRAYFTASQYATVRVQGTIQQSGVTVNDFRIPIIYEVTAQDGTLKNYTVIVGESPDTTKPVVSNAVQTVNNLPGQFVLVRSNEATGKVYIVKMSVPQATVADLEAAVAAGNGRSTYVTAANTDIPIGTANLADGTYYAYAIDAAGNKSLKGTNAIYVLDRIAPTVYVDAQTKLNALNSVVFVQSSESNSIVYLIPEGIPQQSKIHLDEAVTAKLGARALVLFANSDVPVNIYNLAAGNYHAYASDISGNISAPSTNVVVITEASHFKSILAFSFEQLVPPAIGQIIGNQISVVVPVGTSVNALVATYISSPLAIIRVGSVIQVSGVTANNFTTPLTYKVTAEDGTSQEYLVTVSFNTGIDDDVLTNSIKAYPNPVSDRLTLEMTRPMDRIIILNSLGQTMEDIMNPGQTTLQIPTETWTKGLYFVRYFSDQKFVGIHKIIKE
jgi:hypothetical protein